MEMETQTLKELHPSDNPNLRKGAFQVSRSIYQSEVWSKDHIYLKALVWMIGKANHQPNEKDGFAYHRGEFYTTYDEIREALKTYHHHTKTVPTLKRARVIVEWFVRKRMIEKTPVRESEAPPNFHPFPTQNGSFGTEKRAYVGLRIRIVKYDLYQTLDNYKGRPRGTHRGRQGADQGHYNKKELKNELKKDLNHIEHPKKDAPNPEVKIFMDFYFQKFKEKFGIDPLIEGGKDGKLVRGLLKRISLSDLKTVLLKFFNSDDKFIKESGYTMGAFKSQINKLRLGGGKQDGIDKATQRLKDAINKQEQKQIGYDS